MFNQPVLRVLALAACFSAPLSAAELATKTALTLDVAKALSSAAEVEAAKNKWSVVIAIVDDGGRLIHLVRRDGTQIASVDVAQGKASSAVGFKRPTKALEDTIAGGRNAMLGIQGLTPVQGGLPLVVNGETIGAIGVSGVTSAQDEQVAQAGVAALAAFVRKN
ncbi:MAG: heme-binding protein [Steroidobacteraceae bacterium]